MTLTELKPIRAPAIDGVSIVPVTGNNAPAAMGSPTCKIPHHMRSHKQNSQHAYISNLSVTFLKLRSNTILAVHNL